MSLIMTKAKSSKIRIGEVIVKSSDCEKLLGVKIDSRIIFDDCKKKLTKTASISSINPAN